jgi:hypothetical protein
VKTAVRKNLSICEETEEASVAGEHEKVFKLRNDNMNEVKSGLRLGIGHTDYREHLHLILRHI